jgi:tRNA nucleotidyltransferase (CCA-adding enzyme)
MYLDRKTIKTCILALSIRDFPEGSIGIKRLLAQHGVDVVRYAAAAHDTLRGGDALAKTDQTIASGECFSLCDLAVTGRDLIALGHSPCSELGETLKKLLDHVLTHPEDNSRDKLLEQVNLE